MFFKIVKILNIAIILVQIPLDILACVKENNSNENESSSSINQTISTNPKWPSKKELGKIWDDLRTALLTPLQLQHEPEVMSFEPVPQNLLKKYKAQTGSDNLMLPIILRAYEAEWNSKNNSNKFFMKLNIPKNIFKSVNHALVEIYIPKPKNENSSFTIIYADKTIKFKKIGKKLDDSKNWLVFTLIIFYLTDDYSEGEVKLVFSVNKINFWDFLDVSEKGALVSISSSISENIINSRSDTCKIGTQCCPVKTSVNLEKIGWNTWILEPKVLKLSYCSGPCNTPQNYYTIHSNILRRMIHVYKDNAPKLKLCCVPREMYSYSFLFYDENGIISSKIIPDVEVKSCICT
ncbi:hypothetical protein HZS_4325 [Henneguya salminicola]|nr:hypothetical protein HZS_4325 [Henneguya salminicola]